MICHFELSVATMPAKKTIKRYNETEKSDILNFIENYNSEKGRGGATAAIKKFGVTAATLSAWSKKSGKKGTEITNNITASPAAIFNGKFK